MSFQDAVRTVLTKKYADFSGRARRSEFWWFFLFNAIVNVITEVIDRGLDTQLVGLLVSLALLIPGLAVGARRLHDTGRSGWWQLIALTIVGIIPLIIWWAQEGKPEANEHGPNPKAVAAPAAA